MPAKSIDSYKETLYRLLEVFQPQTVLEWGSGISTGLIASWPSVEQITTIEHDPYYYELMLVKGVKNLNLHLIEDMEVYARAFGKYDLCFVDGRNRSECLESAHDCSDLIILHDSARGDYRPAINAFEHRVWTDGGNTVVLTNNSDVASTLESILADIACDCPECEQVTICGDLGKI